MSQGGITKCDSYFITKCDKRYYKVRQVLYKVRQVLSQSATGITKCDVITKCDGTHGRTEIGLIVLEFIFLI